jgi:hypothetical protein
MIRTTDTTVVFQRPFALRGVERSLPAGTYRVITDETPIEGVSFLAYRRISTVMLVPGGVSGQSIEMVEVDPTDLENARLRDAEPVRYSS